VQAKEHEEMQDFKKNPAIYPPVPDDVERIGKIVLDAAYKVHSTLGPGLLASVYETCLAYEVRESGVAVQTQVVLPIA
jgi:hypothetical protein